MVVINVKLDSLIDSVELDKQLTSILTDSGYKTIYRRNKSRYNNNTRHDPKYYDNSNKYKYVGETRFFRKYLNPFDSVKIDMYYPLLISKQPGADLSRKYDSSKITYIVIRCENEKYGTKLIDILQKRIDTKASISKNMF
ncbi:MAG: hypothetical protein M1433_00070 [Candidatus Parvarchaeota archaeon]|jgi:hypothetical protein|nr:hypothetical protein [Candidatus Parvarchaeota archaeon]